VLSQRVEGRVAGPGDVEGGVIGGWKAREGTGGHEMA